MGSSGAGGAHDSSASGRTWGSVKDRGKTRRLDRPHHLFRSLDVTQTRPATTTTATVTTTRTLRPVQVDRLTDTPSPPPVFRWNGAACYSQPHASLALWAKELEDEEASFSCDSLDPSLAAESSSVAAAFESTAAPSPSPSCPTPRKRWQSPAESRRPSMMGLEEPLEPSGPAQSVNGGGASEEQALHPRFVCWELPFSSLRSDAGPAKPLGRVQPRMRSEFNKPAVHRCELKAQRKFKTSRSRTSSRERAAKSEGPESMPDVAGSSNQPKTKWTRRINVQQLLPSKARFSSSSLDVRSDGQSRRGTLHRQQQAKTNYRTRA